MRAEAWLLTGTVIAALLGLLGTWLMIRQQGRQSRTTDAQQIIDQLQENGAATQERHEREMAVVRQEVAALRSELAEARRDVDDVKDRMEGRERVLMDYAALLRWHIDQGLGPPPPVWPAALMHPPPSFPPAP